MTIASPDEMRRYALLDEAEAALLGAYHHRGAGSDVVLVGLANRDPPGVPSERRWAMSQGFRVLLTSVRRPHGSP